ALRLQVYCKQAKDAGRAGHWELSLELLRALVERPCGLENDILPQNVALSACERSGRWAEARQLLLRTARCGPRLSLVTYNTFISALARGHKWQDALHMLVKTRAASVVPDVVSYNAASHACREKSYEVSSQLWVWSLHVLRSMTVQTIGLEPSIVSYNSASNACSRASQWLLCLSLLADMRSRGVDPDDQSRAIAIGALGSFDCLLQLLLEGANSPTRRCAGGLEVW
ncbi:unnamed protein product, partial [Polarella glacialis]